MLLRPFCNEQVIGGLHGRSWKVWVAAGSACCCGRRARFALCVCSLVQLQAHSCPSSDSRQPVPLACANAASTSSARPSPCCRHTPAHLLTAAPTLHSPGLLQPAAQVYAPSHAAGTVLKRFDSSKLFKLTCSDIVERFHLLVSLSFVLVEDMDNSGESLTETIWQLQCLSKAAHDQRSNSIMQA